MVINARRRWRWRRRANAVAIRPADADADDGTALLLAWFRDELKSHHQRCFVLLLIRYSQRAAFFLFHLLLLPSLEEYCFQFVQGNASRRALAPRMGEAMRCDEQIEGE